MHALVMAVDHMFKHCELLLPDAWSLIRALVDVLNVNSTLMQGMVRATTILALAFWLHHISRVYLEASG